jgi:hypothetical protein
MPAYEEPFRLFIENVKTFKQAFKWQNMLSVHLGAILLVSNGTQADEDRLISVKELIKNSTGAFSNLRGNSNLPLIALLSQSGNPEKTLQDTIHVQNLLKAEGFFRNDHLALAAAQIALRTPPEKHSLTVSRTREFYLSMREKHPVATGDDDYIFSFLLANSGLEVQSTIETIEEIMALLKPHFTLSTNLRQALAQILALGMRSAQEASSLEQAVNRVFDLRDALKEHKLDPGFDVASMLGVLSLLPGRPDAIASQVSSCFNSLQAEKAFGKWHGKSITLLCASSLAALGIAGEMLKSETDSAISTITANIIIAQQTAIITAASFAVTS